MSPAPLRRLAAVVFAGVLCVSHRSLAAQQADAPDTSATEVLLQLRIDGGPSEVVTALGRDTLVTKPRQ